MSDKKTTTVLENNPARNAWTILDRSGQTEFPSEETSATEIWGYTNSMSYLPCDTLKLHVHTSAAKFNVVIYRDGFRMFYYVSQQPKAHLETDNKPHRSLYWFDEKTNQPYDVPSEK